MMPPSPNTAGLGYPSPNPALLLLRYGTGSDSEKSFQTHGKLELERLVRSGRVTG